eukprot:GILJ01013724.1.p1 GENE.GILJ01013724.1~~GILJ01013724.1.p1  ORF type:complete len:243 (+),score=37.15 GILJ01013724.1:137-865(+)
MDVVSLLGIVGIAVSGFLYASPFPSVVTAARKRDNSHLNNKLLFCLLLNCSMWVCYGFRKNDHFIYGLNLFGMAVSVGFAAVYHKLNHSSSSSWLTFLLYYCAIPAACFVLFLLVVPLTIVGVVTCAFNCLMFVSTLATMRRAIETANKRLLPLAVALGSVAAGSVWTVYGILIGDIFVIVPNALGVVLGVLQLVVLTRLTCLVKSKSRRTVSMRSITVVPIAPLKDSSKPIVTVTNQCEQP